MITWTECTEERYDEMLGVLPPAAIVGSAFLVGEAVSDRGGRPTFDAFKQESGKCFSSSEAVTFREFKAEFLTAQYWYE